MSLFQACSSDRRFASRDEHAIGQPVVTHILPDVLGRISSGDLGGNGSRLMLAGSSVSLSVPAGLIQQNHRVRAWRDGLRDLVEVQGHRGAVAPWQHEPGADPALGADGAEV